MKKEILTEYVRTKILIKKAFNINAAIPKGYGTLSSDYEDKYKKKRILMHKILEKIKKYNLPIKYGGGSKEKYTGCYTILYFGFEGHQFSFHFYNNEKKYKGNWVGTRRTQFQYWKRNKKLYGLPFLAVAKNLKVRPLKY